MLLKHFADYTQKHWQIAITKFKYSILLFYYTGTGKTYTGIKLIYIFNEFNRLLREQTKGDRKQIVFCGPSNKSVDLVASKYVDA